MKNLLLLPFLLFGLLVFIPSCSSSLEDNDPDYTHFPGDEEQPAIPAGEVQGIYSVGTITADNNFSFIDGEIRLIRESDSGFYLSVVGLLWEELLDYSSVFYNIKVEYSGDKIVYEGFNPNSGDGVNYMGFEYIDITVEDRDNLSGSISVFWGGDSAIFEISALRISTPEEAFIPYEEFEGTYRIYTNNRLIDCPRAELLNVPGGVMLLNLYDFVMDGESYGDILNIEMGYQKETSILYSIYDPDSGLPFGQIQFHLRPRGYSCGELYGINGEDSWNFSFKEI